MIKVINIVGTRPNFIKIAPLMMEMNKHRGIRQMLVHTGQHYDAPMSKFFFDDLNIPKPDVNLEVGSASDVTQTAMIMLKLEKILLKEKPDFVIVVGDVNSTFAAAVSAKKCGIKVAHIEAGLRSFDMSMLEEINRIAVDHLSDLLFTTEESANRNLLNEGIGKSRIYFVGNVMIDTLLEHKEKSKESKTLDSLKIRKNEYCALTLHRPSNVDNAESLAYVLGILDELQQQIKIVFPVHPRTLKNIKKFGLEAKLKNMENLLITPPLGYLDFLCLISNSKFVITDSGGIQEETTVLGVPCVTMRNNTERPITVEEGTNVLVSTDKKKIIDACTRIVNGMAFKRKIPKFWDGKAAGRIVKILLEDRKGN